MDLILTNGMNLVYAVATLALIALGLAVVFGLLGVMNMAHGEFVMLGAFSVYVTQQAGLPMLAAIPLAIAVCAIVGYLVEWSIVRHLYSRPFDTLLATWGLSILMRKLVEAGFGRDYKSIDQVLPGTVDVFGIAYPSYRLLLLAVIAIFFGLLFAWYRRSNTGARIKAMVSNPQLAAAVGIDTARLARMTFVFGVCTAGLAGVALAPLVRVEPYMGIDYLLSSFFILVVGGLGSLEGLLIGSSVIGGTDTVISTLFAKTSGYMAVLLISILFLWLRPDGLFSRR
ncbi:branched-chain amino acid ABC transporter permease [Hoeflea poritis]|uniref:Branched-chain amino acid ABC transporter permease n=1 Tax=Hoeflea poritis TaxID=2993659 RepID=A0ABT4VML3_9HYPH|nr:branched-chain amino acid ABC transporter permease [Hoeflea poritis]MDA4845906.1 branched-chain amino acid ABC transporter permease [Hoeflea poritis]